ncbi:MAG: pyridoxal phosphate-dependent aminotransferase [Planctomycetota bacterium]
MEHSQQSCSRRAAEMPPFLVMEVLERAAQLQREGRSIIHLEVGEPDFDTPPAAVAAGIAALRAGRTHYTHSLGHPELRAAIVAWHERHYGVATSPERVVVTVGTSGAMLLVFAALLDPGDEVLITDPGYACYPNFIATFGGVPVRVPVCEADGFQFEPRAVAAALTPRTRALVINSPANPTGTLTTPERMRELAALCGMAAGEASAGSGSSGVRGITEQGQLPGKQPCHPVIISDEIYHGLVYRGRAHTIREFAPEAVVVSGFSKLHAMTGWRLGYAILPEWLVRPVQKLQQNLFISAPDFPQFAAVAALEQADADIEQMRRCYDERRQLVLARLQEMGLTILTEPVGAFYVFVNVRQHTDDVYKFAFRVLEEAGVAITPGTDFGPGGAGYIRISYANSLANIEEGMRRLRAFLQHS